MQIIPAVLETNPASFFFQIKRLMPYFKHFQIDVSDGMYVKSTSIQLDSIAEFANQYHFQNYYHSLSFEIHLMVKDYQSNLDKLAKLKNLLQIKTVLLHFSLRPNFHLLCSNYPSFSLGLVLNPQDQIEELAQRYNLRLVPIIQIMSVNPGFQGGEFLPQTLKKIEQLRSYNYRNKISLDGGINEQTLPLILSQKTTPDYLCIGSYLKKAQNLPERIKYLLQTIR